MATKQEERKESRLIEQHRATLWAHFANIFLGAFLLASSVTFGMSAEKVFFNNLVCGGILIFFGMLSLSRRMTLAPWIVALTGVWLSFAPLLFWAEHAYSYINDTMVGVLAVAFSLLIPGMPGVIEESHHSIPPGWSYNPSSWIQRLPIIALAFLGWMISRALDSYQVGYIHEIWDPVFGDGTSRVITSKISRLLPVSDAGLGAFAYTLEALLGCKGGEARWRTMPWLVVFFAFLVVPLGVVSILLVISQPILVDAWCLLCLVAAFSMLFMVMLTIDEMVAVFYFLYLAYKAGNPFWRTFWKGGDIEGTKDDLRTPSFQESPWKLLKTWRFGLSFPVTLVFSALIGGFLMLSPFLFSLPRPLANNDHLFGALIIVLSFLSFSEPARCLRLLLIPIALWLFFSPWYLSGHNVFSLLLHLLLSFLLFFLAPYKGKIRETYGLML